MSGIDDGHTPLKASDIQISEINGCKYAEADFYKQQHSIEDLLAAAVGPKQANLKPKIQQVPSVLRSKKNLEQFFEPRLISFGPVHYGNAKYQEAETFKLNWAKKFVENSCESAEVLMSRIENHIQELRGCFQCEFNLNDKNLAMFLLVEGCAVLYFIDCMAENKLGNLDLNSNQAAFVERDMFLLENQLPLGVLELLIAPDDARYIERRNSWVKTVKKFIYSTSVASHIQYHDRPLSREPSPETMEAPHLLGLLRESLLGSKELRLDVKGEENISRKKGDFLEVKGKCWEKNKSVVELQELGVKFTLGKRGFLNDVCYIGYSAFENCLVGTAIHAEDIKVDPSTLSIPGITIDVSTGSMLMNMISYEMCTDFKNEFEVTSYICFLNALIDGPEDVRELRRARIVRNCLGSDKEVAQLFHEMAKDLVPNLELFDTTRKGIILYCRSKTSRWAMFVNTRFRKPWSLFATIATIATIVSSFLSAYQLYYAAKT